MEGPERSPGAAPGQREEGTGPWGSPLAQPQWWDLAPGRGRTGLSGAASVSRGGHGRCTQLGGCRGG